MKMFAPIWTGGALPVPHDGVKRREVANDARDARAAGRHVGAARAAAVARARARPALAAPVYAVPMMDVTMASAVAPSSLPGVRALTYSVKARKKTANINPQIVQIMVKGRPRYQMRSTCSETGAQKCTFLTNAKTGGRLRH